MLSELQPEVWQWRIHPAEMRDECLAQRLADAIYAEFSIAQQRRGDLELVLAELINNSIDHGILQLESTLKKDPQGFEQYFISRAKQLAALDHGYIDVGVQKPSAQMIRISVQDSGSGFDFHQRLPAVSDENMLLAYGRGLLIVRNLCESIVHIGNGNCIVADFTIKRPCVVDVV